MGKSLFSKIALAVTLLGSLVSAVLLVMENIEPIVSFFTDIKEKLFRLKDKYFTAKLAS